MLMGYLNIVCPRCDRKIRHHMRDLELRKKRVCPDCGILIDLVQSTTASGSDQPS